MLPEVNSLSGGNKEAISFQAARLLSAATPGPPSGSVGVAFSQESGGPALSHGFGSPPGWPLEVFHVHCDSPAHKSGIYLAFLMEMGSPVCLLICFSLQELLMGISARFQESPR